MTVPLELDVASGASQRTLPQADRIVPLFGTLLKNEPLPKDGLIYLSDAPGFGVELNDDLKRVRPYARPQK